MLIWVACAFGAEVTDMPTELRGDLEIRYDGSTEFGFLEEGTEAFGKRRLLRHTVTYTGEFSPVEGLALVVAVPHTPFLRASYSEATQMIFEPVSGGGTYTFGDPLNKPPQFTGSGIEGVWLGAAFAPFSERYKRRQLVTWRIDLAYRTANKRSFYTAGEGGGKRGAAPGGSAFKVGAAFSSNRGITNPYLDVEYIRENKVVLDVFDDDGTAVASQLELQPPSKVDTVAGTSSSWSDSCECGTKARPSSARSKVVRSSLN